MVSTTGRGDGAPWEYQFTLNDKTVNVTIEEAETDTYRVTSIATTNEDSSTTVLAYVGWLPADGSAGFNSMDPEEYTEEETYDGGNFIVSPNEEHVGNVYVTNGNVELYENAVIDGNVYVANGNVQFKGAGALITGSVYSSGDTQLEISDSTIEGHVIAGGMCN